ncbi:hypothetical protein ACX8XP_13125 [Calditrichota bacterium LG25]
MKTNSFLTFILFGIIYNFLPAQNIDTLWRENWEGDWTQDWHVDAGTWEVGTPTSGPGNAYEGQNCAATVLTGNYAEPVESRIIRHVSFIIPVDSESPRLRFWHWYRFARGDYGVVQIKIGNGEWQTISDQYTGTCSSVWSKTLIDRIRPVK